VHDNQGHVFFMPANDLSKPTHWNENIPLRRHIME